MTTLHYLPPVKPSAIALGTFFTHTASLGILAPVFGDTYHRAQAANTKEEFIKSKEAAGAAAAWGSSLVGSAMQTYGVAALINATGTLSYKGAAYLGSLIFMASSAPSFISQIFTEKRPLDTVAVGAVSRVFETVGLSLFLTWWGYPTLWTRFIGVLSTCSGAHAVMWKKRYMEPSNFKLQRTMKRLQWDP